MSVSDKQVFVTLDKYKSDLSCHQAKWQFIHDKIKAKIGSSTNDVVTDVLIELLDWIDLPASSYISDFDWKKVR